jgi:hypothetical protein
MLKRVSGAVFEAPAGAEVRIVARARANNGVQDARFEYGSAVLDRETIAGLPGARFTVEAARRRFQALVIFDPAAASGARYDLFEVDDDGVLAELEESVSKSDSAPLVGFVVKGVAPSAIAGPAGPARAAGPRATASRPTPAAARAAKRKGARTRPTKAAPRKRTAAKTASARTRATARRGRGSRRRG